MGPRSCERGNSVGSPAKPNPGDGFNGAALVRARKFGFARADCQLWQASMGPRSCERGNDFRRQHRRQVRLCFNGAALVRARK